jgi:uncharacterized protein (TIGR02266 family)
MSFPALNCSKFKDYSLRINPSEETLSLYDSEGLLVKSIRLEELFGFLLESNKNLLRKNLRASLAVKIKYQNPSGVWNESITGTLGTGGLFIETPEPLQKGSEFNIEFTLPDTPLRVINATGKVVWTRNQLEKILYFPGMGMEFVNISDDEKSAIRRMIMSINKSRGIQIGTADQV